MKSINHLAHSVTDATPDAANTQPRWLTRLARRLVHDRLQGLQSGGLTIEEPASKLFVFGDKSGANARIRVRNPEAYIQILLGGSIGAGEAYMDGHWDSPDLVAVVRLMVRNMALLENLDSSWSFVSSAIAKVLHRRNDNSRRGSKRNIAAHYDLGNDFFRLFLDPTMLYSAAVFPSESASLHEASVHKLEKICQKLQLSESDHLLEIGTGWGGMAVHAAKHYGCHVTTTTISREQYQYAKAWVEKEGLQDRVTLLLNDYRDLQGKYDKIVSIEMIEAVGYAHYHEFFHRCSHLLKPEGRMVMQAITIQDQRFHSYRKSVDFIQRYIFPGGCLPSNQIIAEHIADSTDMQIVGLEDITHDYARTLRAWREAFFAQLDAVRAQGFDRRFIHMWDYYLCYCEGGFLERAISTAQFVFAKPRCTPTRF